MDRLRGEGCLASPAPEATGRRGPVTARDGAGAALRRLASGDSTIRKRKGVLNWPTNR